MKRRFEIILATHSRYRDDDETKEDEDEEESERRWTGLAAKPNHALNLPTEPLPT
jgi:hypothetical protein